MIGLENGGDGLPWCLTAVRRFRAPERPPCGRDYVIFPRHPFEENVPTMCPKPNGLDRET